MKAYFNRGQGGEVRGQEEGGEGTRRDRVKGRLYKEYILHERARRMNAVLNWINLDSQCGSAIHKLDEPLGSSLKELYFPRG